MSPLQPRARRVDRLDPLPDLVMGRIASDDPAALTIVIDAFDGGEPAREEWPAVFSPRGHLTPRRGDRCAAVRVRGLDDTLWVVVWWDGPIPDPPEEEA